MSRRDRNLRRNVLLSGLAACYEIIDRIRRELAEIDAADRVAKENAQ